MSKSNSLAGPAKLLQPAEDLGEVALVVVTAAGSAVGVEEPVAQR